jgi:gliding motility-associated-like protein
LFVPNAFSPNRDGKNDEFRFIVNANNIELREFIIADRWGGIAFSTQQVNDSWNGRTLGGDAAVGTYYYFIRYLCKFTGKILTVKGDVTLIR